MNDNDHDHSARTQPGNDNSPSLRSTSCRPKNRLDRHQLEESRAVRPIHSRANSPNGL